MQSLGMNAILLRSNPFKVLNSVIRLYAVFMVGFFSNLSWSEKRGEHKAMYCYAT